MRGSFVPIGKLYLFDNYIYAYFNLLFKMKRYFLVFFLLATLFAQPGFLNLGAPFSVIAPSTAITVSTILRGAEEAPNPYVAKTQLLIKLVSIQMDLVVLHLHFIQLRDGYVIQSKLEELSCLQPQHIFTMG